MPKLDRATFLLGLDDLWQLAQRNFAKDGTLHGCVVGLDAMGRQKFLMQGPEDDPQALSQGFVPIPGPWREHTDRIAATFHAHKAVAAVLLGEAWTVADEYASETLRMDIFPHEHPMADEIVFVVGFWPREYVAAGYRATIVRDEGTQQHPRLDRLERLDSNDTVLMGPWLQDLLPAPHH